MNNAAPIAAAVLFIAIMCCVFWWQVSVWNECRTDHSWMYCINLIRK